MQTLDDVQEWVLYKVSDYGGEWETPPRCSFYPIWTGDEEQSFLDVYPTRVFFPGDRRLDIEMVVAQTSTGLEYVTYGFHYSLPDRPMVWRYDKHPGHEDEMGTDCHVHLGNTSRKTMHPTDVVALDSVLQEMHEHK